MNEITSPLSTALADRYRIERELGAGGMATVYLAHVLKHDRRVALKVLHPDSAHTLGRSEAAHEERLMLTIKAWPALASLHDESRYRAIVHRMGLPE